jgi:AhpD family alkylhydroperoxidase
MEARINYIKVAPEIYKKMLSIHEYLQSCGLEEKLLDLVYLRASQINGCAYCIDMHSKDLRVLGEPEQKLYLLNAWRESPGFSDRERAALEWTESVTLVTQGAVPDAVYENARRHFNEQELANLTLALVAINGWNRLNVAFRTPAGGYQPKVMKASAS